MKINEWFRIEVGIVEIKNDGTPGDVYDDMENFKCAHPNSGYRFGYYVVDEDGHIPENCNDWNDSPEEAMADYRYNCAAYINEY